MLTPNTFPILRELKQISLYGPVEHSHRPRCDLLCWIGSHFVLMEHMVWVIVTIVTTYRKPTV